VSDQIICNFSCFYCCCLQVSARLVDFRELVRDVVRSACRSALLEAGFTPDDYFYDTMDTAAAGWFDYYFYYM